MHILHLDADLVAVNKPAGIVVHRGAAQDDITMMTLVRDTLDQWVYPVHRLDRGTSGVLLMALNKAMARALSTLFANHAVHKSYVALVRGLFPEQVRVDRPVPNDEGGERVAAVTDMQRLEVLAVAEAPFPHRYSWIRASPLSGRRHQIRRHSRHVGLPLIGDTTYGRTEHNHFCRDRFGLARLALHAEMLTFVHPASGVALRLQAPLPDDLAGPLDAMRGDKR